MSSLDQLRSAMVSDALDTLGSRNQVLQGDIVPLRRGMRACGRAAVVEFEPSDVVLEAPYDDMIDFIDSLQPGALVVIATGGCERSGYWGELFSAAAIGRGAAGVVCDSYVRDSPQILDLDFAAFARGSRPIDFRGRMRVKSVGAPAMCGGVRIAPGDVILADDDGVVAIPQEVEQEVVRRAIERAERESTVLQELQSGAYLRSVWERHRVL